MTAATASPAAAAATDADHAEPRGRSSDGFCQSASLADVLNCAAAASTASEALSARSSDASRMEEKEEEAAAAEEEEEKDVVSATAVGGRRSSTEMGPTDRSCGRGLTCGGDPDRIAVAAVAAEDEADEADKDPRRRGRDRNASRRVENLLSRPRNRSTICAGTALRGR